MYEGRRESHFDGLCGAARRPLRRIALLAGTIGLALAAPSPSWCMTDSSAMSYLDQSDGRDWPGYGRTFGEQHYSPLAQVNHVTVGRLNLDWSLDLGPENSATQPIEVDGTLYFATGYSLVHAVDVRTGKLLWRFDPKAAEVSGLNLRWGWGSRGIAWWDGKIFTGTQDGRLIAIDASTGRQIWSVQTLEPNMPAFISGAPRVFGGKVIVGFASDTGAVRGYVTAYDASTGRKLWRFYTVPGNPANGFESPIMERAAKTWAGEWWKFGGGGTVWNAMAYDVETDTVYIGTGNGYPVNRRVRSRGKGDNWFIASIIALNGTSGEYRWHYQVNPGESWDYDDTMDIELADLLIHGKKRKVLLQAPKNGYFYVIDRTDGKLISAEPYAKVTWAKRIDSKTGRPIQPASSQFPNGSVARIWPSIGGAHGWAPMAYSPKSGLAYIPMMDSGLKIWDRDIDPNHWMVPTDRRFDAAIEAAPEKGGEDAYLLAWNPITQKAAWKLPRPTHSNGGVLATAGDLVFQGTVDGLFKAYSASNGNTLWQFDAQAPLYAPPISYQVGDIQYVSILTGLGTQSALVRGQADADKYHLDPREQARRVLTFSLGGAATLPPTTHSSLVPEDPTYQSNRGEAELGRTIYDVHCSRCHGWQVVASIHAPDLRRSAIPLSDSTFASVVRDGAFSARGMPSFSEFSADQLRELREYIRTAAADLRTYEAEHR